jgi:hypothetical protein
MTGSRRRSPAISIRSRHSPRALAIQRSATAFARGAWTGVLMMRTPIAANPALHFAAQSRIKNLKPSA